MNVFNTSKAKETAHESCKNYKDYDYKYHSV